MLSLAGAYSLGKVGVGATPLPGLHHLPLIHLLFAECLAERYQVPNVMSLVRPGRGFESLTLFTEGEHSTTRPPSLLQKKNFKVFFCCVFHQATYHPRWYVCFSRTNERHYEHANYQLYNDDQW